jgi:3-mercaptopyruvate sulfurtransferase SseA
MPKFLLKLRTTAFLTVMLVLAAGCSTTSGTVSPSDEVSAETSSEADAAWRFHAIAEIGLIQENAVVPQPEGVLIIDSRPYQPKYVKGHIPTAISMPFSQFDKMTDKLPEAKDSLLIFYCGGPT